ncbi:MAG: PKD domain-containing protein, partial [Bacteroidota bacterium]|nr:PKD domain-containing protein [Bacteroidota bacterium]
MQVYYLSAPMLPRILSLVFLFIQIYVASGQQVKTFQKVYGGSSNEYGFSVCEMADHGFLTLCLTASYGAGNFDLMLTRTDSLGRHVWNKTYGGTGVEGTSTFNGGTSYKSGLVQVEDSSFLILSQTKSYGNGDADAYVIKVDKKGNVKWAKTYGGTSEDAVFHAAEFPGGGYVIAGETKSYGAGGQDVLLIKTDTAGSISWARTYGASAGNDVVYSLAVSKTDSSVFLAGHTNSYSSGRYRMLLIKATKTGTVAWSKVFGQSSTNATWNFAMSIVEDGTGQVYVCGQSEIITTSSGGDVDLTIAKFSSSGTLIWGKRYDYAYREGLTDIFLDGPYIYSVAWASGVSGAPATSVYQLKTDTAGTFKWLRVYGITSGTATMNFGTFYKKLRSGGTVMLVSTSGAGAGGYDAYLIKADTSGTSSSCYLSTQTPSTSTYNVAFISHTSFSSSTQTLGTGSGYKTSTVSPKDTFICEPFVTHFGWKNVCEAQVATFLDSSYRSADAWKWNFGDPSSGTANTSTSQNPTHTFDTAGIYFVKLVSSRGSAAKDSVTYKVKVATVPVARAWGDTAICAGDSAVLYASGGSSYLWTPAATITGANTANPYVKPLVRTYYGVKVTNNAGCSDYDTVEVDILTDTTLAAATLNCVSIETDSTVKLSWTPTNDSLNFSHYRVSYRYKGNSTYNFIANVSPRTATSAIVTMPVTLDSVPLEFSMESINRCGTAGSRSNRAFTMVIAKTQTVSSTVGLKWNKPFASMT